MTKTHNNRLIDSIYEIDNKRKKRKIDGKYENYITCYIKVINKDIIGILERLQCQKEFTIINIDDMYVDIEDNNETYHLNARITLKKKDKKVFITYITNFENFVAGNV